MIRHSIPWKRSTIATPNNTELLMNWLANFDQFANMLLLYDKNLILSTNKKPY